MFNKMYNKFRSLFLRRGTYTSTNVEAARKVLSSHTSNNAKVLELYDRVAKSWIEYDALHEGRWGLEKLLNAVEYAAEMHKGLPRKDVEKTPYIVHPIRVSELLWVVGSVRSVNVLTAAVLHDTLEDTAATEEEIESLFGKRILQTVKEVSNDSVLSSEENKQRQVDHAPSMSLDGQLVKLADRLCNITDLELSPPDWEEEKVARYYAWGEKLLLALKGANIGMEQELERRIQMYKARCDD